MTDFAEEARSRTAWLLRMAAPEQDAGSIIEYATTTPEPPVMGPHGIRTRGCPRCRRTMWMQREIWVCAFCGHVEELACSLPPVPDSPSPAAKDKAAPGESHPTQETRHAQGVHDA